MEKFDVIAMLSLAIPHHRNTEAFFRRRLQEDPPAGVSGAPSENNIMIWNAVMFG